jgi:hypothetical protein
MPASIASATANDSVLMEAPAVRRGDSAVGIIPAA